MASNIKTHRITNANIYANGESLLGFAEEINLPELKALTADHKGLGLYGQKAFVSGMDKMEGSIKWNSFYPEAIAFFGDFTKIHDLQIRSSVEVWEAGAKTEVPLVIFVQAQFTQFPLGAFKQNENVEVNTNFIATYFRMEFDGVEQIEYDATANIYRVQGVDLLAQYKANIGQ